MENSIVDFGVGLSGARLATPTLTAFVPRERGLSRPGAFGLTGRQRPATSPTSAPTLDGTSPRTP